MYQLALAIFALAQPQNQTLADYVQALQWDASKRGPLMVLEPETVQAKKGLDGLAAFRRTRTSLTGVSAIIPETMVLIDDSMLQSPNLYDGLPRHSKVLYLMSTLDGNQWRQATGGGLGMNDLTKDQQAVFRSLLPRPFKLMNYSVNAQGQMDSLKDDRELSDSDLGSVRLHLERSLNLMMPLAGMPGSYSPRDTNSYYGAKGAHGITRNTGDDFRKQDAFGMNIRQTVPNQLKPSDLNYGSTNLSGTIPLNPSEKISDLLGRIGQKTGLELHADLRVGDRQMVSIGRSAPITSVLKTVALSVTGTFRNVGGAYILTSALAGMGSRQLRLAAYDDALNRKVNDEETKWREDIAKAGHLKEIKFREGDDLAPDDRLAQKIDKGWNVKITSTDLNDSLRNFVQAQNQIDTSQQVTADGAVVSSRIEYSFVMPSGDMTRPEWDSLGQADEFVVHAPRTQEHREDPSFPKLNMATVKIPLAICRPASSPDEAQHAVAYAQKFGVKDLWLDTWSPDTLKAAIEAAGSSVTVSLVIRPFAYGGPEDAAAGDRTLSGDTPPESYERRMADTTTITTQELKIRPPEDLGCISPLSSDFRSRVARAVELAKTPGLAGIRIIASTPNGYNGPRVNYISFPGPLFLEMGNFGYAADLRLAFMRIQGIDPIDLCPGNIHTNSDLRQPFFLDDQLRGGTSVYDGTDVPNPAMEGMMNAYDAWLSKQNRGALQAMLDGISHANPHLNLMVDAIPLQTNAVNRVGGGLKPWKPGDPLPEFGEGRRQAGQAELFFQHVSVSEQNMATMSAAAGYMAQIDAETLKKEGMSGGVIDLRLLTQGQADRFMDQSFVVDK